MVLTAVPQRIDIAWTDTTGDPITCDLFLQMEDSAERAHLLKASMHRSGEEDVTSTRAIINERGLMTPRTSIKCECRSH